MIFYFTLVYIQIRKITSIYSIFTLLLYYNYIYVLSLKLIVDLHVFRFIIVFKEFQRTHYPVCILLALPFNYLTTPCASRATRNEWYDFLIYVLET